MARKRVKLALILNESTRSTCCRKRTKGLLKKVEELSTLCGLEMAVVANIPNHPHPDVWPSVPDAIRTVEKFKALPEIDQSRKKMNQEGFFRQRIEKLTEEANKLAKRNKEMYMETVLYQCLNGGSIDGLSGQELDHLSRMIDARVKQVEEAILVACDLKNKEKQPSVLEEEIIPGNINIVDGGVPAGGLPLELQILKEQTWFMEAMNDPDQLVPLSTTAMPPLKPFDGDGDDLIDGFTGDI
ncbi:hypothetical protein H6P81_001761 [Aristolochia fimbriata]|uniref:MADS-box domain-containing protein n=1 Tax=Aristolochia fimbriata TaxID=158543 RepID=A0AAV7F833_ARIFI|nr:hypothetical protein H6P81_001761 [Aristolochia fimbriata]